MVLKSDKYSSDHIRLNRFVFWSSAVSIGIFGLLFVLFPQKSHGKCCWLYAKRSDHGTRW